MNSNLLIEIEVKVSNSMFWIPELEGRQFENCVGDKATIKIELKGGMDDATKAFVPELGSWVNAQLAALVRNVILDDREQETARIAALEAIENDGEVPF